MPNPLDAVWAWYTTAKDGLRVTRRVLANGVQGAITYKHESFYDRPLADCVAALDAAEVELDRVVVLALTAIFERTLRDHLVQLPAVHLPVGSPVQQAVRREVLKDVEFWNISTRVIDTFDVPPTGTGGGVVRGEERFGQRIRVDGSGHGVGGGPEVIVGTASDSFGPSDGTGLQPRGVRVGVASRTSDSSTLTVVVNRVDGEGATHIIVSFARK